MSSIEIYDYFQKMNKQLFEVSGPDESFLFDANLWNFNIFCRKIFAFSIFKKSESLKNAHPFPILLYSFIELKEIIFFFYLFCKITTHLNFIKTTEKKAHCLIFPQYFNDSLDSFLIVFKILKEWYVIKNKEQNKARNPSLFLCINR